LTALRREQKPAQNRHIRPWVRKLPPYTQREQPADEKPQQRAEEELDPNDLVILREHVRRKKAADVNVLRM
jgi:hypothetical protein